MKVLQLNKTDVIGGAARAAYRIHHALRDAGVESTMCVDRAVAGDGTVEGRTRTREQVIDSLRSHVGYLVRKRLRTSKSIIHSPSVLPSSWPQRLNESDADLVHMHWVCDELLSIKDIGRIRKAVVWTLHDMWAFCGAEHYTEDGRWRKGYRRDNRPEYENGIDLNRWAWKRKEKYWQHSMHIVAPSRWMANAVRASALMGDKPVSMVPNVIDTEQWTPVEPSLARGLLGLPQDVPLLLFGAMGGSRDPRKGFDLLLEALEHMRGEVDGLELLVFGQLPPREPSDLGFPVHYAGHLHDDVSLRLLYSAADLFAIPSRQDNLPNTGVESLACGTPVVAFDIGGLPDIVSHKGTGYLAVAFDTVDFAQGVRWVVDQRDNGGLRHAARSHAVERFSPEVVVPQYLEVYRQAMEGHGA